MMTRITYLFVLLAAVALFAEVEAYSLCSKKVELPNVRSDFSQMMSRSRTFILNAVSINIPPFRKGGRKSSPPSNVDQTAEETRNPTNTIAQASMITSSVNLLKNCVGAGVFSINSKINAISTDPRHFPLLSTMLVAIIAWAVHNFHIVGETCRITKSRTFGEAWSKAVSPSSQWIVQFVITAAPMISCVAGVIVLTDVLNLLLSVIGAPSFLLNSRIALITLLCSFVLFPVCTVKDLSDLKSVSAIGLTGQAVATLSLLVGVLRKSYEVDGKFYHSANIGAVAKEFLAKGSTRLPATPSSFDPSKIFLLTSLLTYCFATHYNAPRYFAELKEKEKNPNRFLFMTTISYTCAAVLYLSTIFLAKKLFTPYSQQAFTLHSFSSQDPLAIIAFSAFGTSVLASFPLIFFTMRNWFISQAERFQVNALSNIPAMTTVLLTLIGGAGVFFKEVGKVGSLAGAMFGSSMMFVFPPIMYISALKKQAEGIVFDSLRSGQSGENRVKQDGKLPIMKIFINHILLALGISIGAMGTFNSVKSLFC